MKLQYFIIFNLFISCSIAKGDESVINKQNNKDDKIRVLIEKGYKITNSKSKENNSLEGMMKNFSSGIGDKALEAVNIIEDVSIERIGSLVAKIRKNLCHHNSKGSYEVWLQVDANTSIVILNASGQTGIKATITCP